MPAWRVAVAAKISPEGSRALDRLVELRRAQDPESKATRSSVAAHLLENAILGGLPRVTLHGRAGVTLDPALYRPARPGRFSCADLSGQGPVVASEP